MFRYYLRCGLIAVSMLMFGSAAAQPPFPEQPITVVVGFGVGGSADRMARMMSAYLSESLGTPVHVVNKKGAGTLLAANYVLSKPSDGYTVFASTFSPYLLNTILDGNAKYTIDDFSYINFQWFDEDLIALYKHAKYKTLPGLLDVIRNKPKTVKASVVKGSAGHLMVKLLLDVNGIPQENLNLVTYNSGGKARAAVAGGVVDFIAISAEGSESIREYIRPVAIISEQRSLQWDVPAINDLLQPLGTRVPVLPGSVRGFATTSKFKRKHPERFAKIVAAMQAALAKPALIEQLAAAQMGSRWVGPNTAEKIMHDNFTVYQKYAYLLKWQR